MIMSDGTKVPDSILIGVERGKWPIQVFQGGVPQEQAADWLARGMPNEKANKRVFLVKLEPVQQMTYVPPILARIEAMPVKPAYTDDGQPQ